MTPEECIARGIAPVKHQYLKPPPPPAPPPAAAEANGEDDEQARAAPQSMPLRACVRLC
jgi:hypothetical protein